jgi:hypothetical protein
LPDHYLDGSNLSPGFVIAYGIEGEVERRIAGLTFRLWLRAAASSRQCAGKQAEKTGDAEMNAF